MRVSLVLNPNAGDGQYAPPHLAALLRQAGHTVTVYDRSRRAIRQAIEDRPDVVVAAGGDGTIARVAIRLHALAADVPLYALPTGTANNVARSLGADAAVPELVERLASARPGTFDIGVLEAPWGPVRFVESAGLGFVAMMLRAENTVGARLRRLLRRMTGRATTGEAEVAAAARGTARQLRAHRPRHYEIIADGDTLSGEYVCVEAMNVRSIGSRLALAPDADVRDGMLDLVLVTADQRDRLATLLEANDPNAGAACECRRVRQVELSWPRHDGHADDEPCPPTGEPLPRTERVRVRVDGRVRTLLP